MPISRSQRILAEGAHALAIDAEAEGIVVVAPHHISRILHQPAEALDRLRAIIHHVAAEDHGVMLRLGRQHRLQGRPVSMNVRSDENSHTAPHASPR